MALHERPEDDYTFPPIVHFNRHHRPTTTTTVSPFVDYTATPNSGNVLPALQYFNRHHRKQTTTMNPNCEF